MPALRWLTRDNDIRATASVPFRLLEESPALSAGEGDSRNTLIQADHLEALKALLPLYVGQVKCTVIDSSYNTCRPLDILYLRQNTISQCWKN